MFRPESAPQEVPVAFSAGEMLRRMLGFLRTARVQVTVATVILLARTIAEVVTVYLLVPTFNIIHKLATSSHSQSAQSAGWKEWLTAPTGPSAELRHALLLLLAANLVLGALTWARHVSSRWQSMSLMFHMRASVYDRLQHVGFPFHDRHSTGQLINRSLSDLNAVLQFLVQGLVLSADIAFTSIGYLYMMAVVAPGMALATLAPLPLWVWAIRWFTKRLKPIYARQMEASDDVVRRYTENMAGAHVVRAFTTEQQEDRAFEASANVYLDRTFESINLQRVMDPVLRGIVVACQIGIFAMGAMWVQSEKIQLGHLVAFGVALNLILARLQQINTITDTYQRASVSCQRLFEILDSTDATPERPDAEPLRPGAGALRLRHVSFAYEPNKPVLNDISLRIPAGATVALMGPTGAGKTTLALLAARFYDPDCGVIEIDGQNERDASLQSVRDAVGYVFQESFLFSDTIRHNIAYGKPDASLKKIRRAARIAHAAEFIEALPDGYDSVIGEQGSNLSGGQMQRLTIARAVLDNPRILVLDDALSAVDPETEAQIRRELERITYKRTVLLITHRIVSARQADFILVMEDGRITQRGTHDELMHQEGYYREVALSQFAGTDDDAPERSHVARVARLSKSSGRFIRAESEGE